MLSRTQLATSTSANMKMPLVTLIATLSASAMFAVAQTTPPSAAVPAPAEAKISAPKLSPEELNAERDKFVKEIRAQIAGHEKEPAETVFKDIKTLKGVPAGRVLAIMNLGYSQSLGVSCTHCHTAGEWDKSDKPQKEIAREMSRLSATINKELLPKIANLDSKQPAVNCTTCHRGEIKPALNLAGAGGPPRPAAPVKPPGA